MDQSPEKVARLTETNETSKNDQDVVDIMSSQDGIGDMLGRRHRFSNSRDVSVVPSVVINECSPVCESGNLVS